MYIALSAIKSVNCMGVGYVFLSIIIMTRGRSRRDFERRRGTIARRRS